MEFIETDLDLLLKHKIDFNEHHLLKIIYNILIALSFMHQANIMHRDIKPANVLITSNCEVKICDFGLSRSIPQTVNKFPDSMNTLKLRHKMAFEKRSGDLWQNIRLTTPKIAEILVSDRPRRNKIKRTMSLHVGSRWYRAPEISMIEKQYD